VHNRAIWISIGKNKRTKTLKTRKKEKKKKKKKKKKTEKKEKLTVATVPKSNSTMHLLYTSLIYCFGIIQIRS
jgi:hypothetical protein